MHMYHSTGCSPIQSIDMMYSRLRGEPGMREDVKHMKTVSLSTGRHQQWTTGERKELHKLTQYCSHVMEARVQALLYMYKEKFGELAFLGKDC